MQSQFKPLLLLIKLFRKWVQWSQAVWSVEAKITDALVKYYDWFSRKGKLLKLIIFKKNIQKKKHAITLFWGPNFRGFSK